MRLSHTGVGVLALVLLASTVHSQTSADDSPRVHVSQRPAISTLNGFVENRGQWPDDVRFLARENGIEAVLLDDALVLHPMPKRVARSRFDEALADMERLADPAVDDARFDSPPAPEPVPGPPLTIRFPGAQSLAGEGVLPTAHHFLLGTGFTRNVPGYERVVFREAAPGIDVVVRTGGGWFAYDLHVAPGADLDALTLEIEGATDAGLVEDGVLVLETAAGRVEMRIGDSWQVDPASEQRVAVASRFQLLDAVDGSLRVGFAAPTRDPARAFVLDPSLVYSTYLGGTGQDVLRDMDVAPDGAVYLVLDTGTAPTTPGAFQTTQVGGLDAWAGKLSPDGSTLEWATYLGGSATELIASIAVDKDGTVVLYGNTFSTDFPITPGSLDTVIENGPSESDLFVTRLTPDGSDLVWSTYYGGPATEVEGTMALFPNGDVLIYGQPVIAIPPSTPGAIDTDFQIGDRLLARISADGTQLVFQTYFLAGVNDIAFDDDSNIYVTGGAGSLFTLTTPGAYKEAVVPGTFDCQITKMNPSGTQVLWSTFLGGDEGTDQPLAIALDAAGAVYVVGHTLADDFPITTGPPGGNGINGFVAKLLPGGSDLVWARSLSSCCGKTTLLWDVDMDPAGNPIVSGNSNSAGFPTTPDAMQPTYGGGTNDAHLTKIGSLGETLVYSTYFGGSAGDSRTDIGFDADHELHLVMQTSSSNLPVIPGAYDPEYSGSGDLLVAGFSIPIAPWRVLGGGVAGSKDTPNFAGAGELTAGSPTRLRVRGGTPTASALLVVGFPAHQFPSRGGLTLAPTGLAVSLTANDKGALNLDFPWPSLPAGLRLTAQVWIQDAGAPGGWSATNKLRLISQ